MKARVVKAGGVWKAYSPDNVWLGESSHWDVALTLALGERLVTSVGWYRSGSLNGIKILSHT